MVNIFLHLPPFPLSLSPFFYLSQSKINVNLPYFLKWSHWDKWFYCNQRGFIHKFWYICCFSIIKCKHMLLFHKFNELVYQLKFEKKKQCLKIVWFKRYFMRQNHDPFQFSISENKKNELSFQRNAISFRDSNFSCVTFYKHSSCSKKDVPKKNSVLN